MPEQTTTTTSDNRQTDGEALQQQHAFGSTTLVQTQPTADGTDTQALVRQTASTAVGLTASYVVKRWLVPGLVKFLREGLRLAAGQITYRPGDSFGEFCLKGISGMALLVTADLVEPVLTEAVELVGLAWTAPQEAAERIGTALTTATYPVFHPFEMVEKTSHLTPHQLATWARTQALRGLRLGVHTGIIMLAHQLSGVDRPPPGFEGPVGDASKLSKLLIAIAPIAAPAITMLFDYELARILPMTDVDPETVPEQLTVAGFDTRVHDPRELATGFYECRLEIAGTVPPCVSDASGVLVAEVADGGRIHTVRPDGFAFSLGDFRIQPTDLTYLHGVGLTCAAAKMTAAKGPQPVFHALTISDYGWLTGSFELEGKSCRFGSEYPGGVHVPTEAATAATERDEVALVAEGGPGLAGSMHRKLRDATTGSSRIGSMLRTVASHGIQIAHQYTGGHNMLAAKPVAKEKEAPPPEPPSPLRRLLEPFGIPQKLDALWERIASVQLVPDEWKEKVSLDKGELSFGPEPSITLGARMGIRPFRTSPGGSADVRLIWLVANEPWLLLQAREVKIADDVAVFRNVELDPVGGLRIATADLALPGVQAEGAFNVESFAGHAEGIQLGHAFNARAASAEAKGITIAKVLTMKRLGISIENSQSNEKRFTAKVEGGKVTVPQAGAMSFLGDFTWGAGALEGGGTAELDQRISMFDTFSIDKANLSFRFDGKKASGSAAVATTLTVRGIVVKAEGAVKFDDRGLAYLSVDKALLKRDADELALLEGFVYDRNAGVLRVGHARILIPGAGPVRGSGNEPKQPSYLHLQNVELSSAIAKIPGPEAPTETAKPAQTGEPVAPAPAPKEPFAIYGENLTKLEIGPSGAPIVEVTLGTPKGGNGFTGTVAVHLGVTDAKGKVTVTSDEGELGGLNVEATAIELGSGGSVARVAHGKHKLEIAGAKISLHEMLKSVWPDELRSLEISLEAGLEADTETRELKRLDGGIKASGKLFGGKVQFGGEGHVVMEGGRVGGPGEEPLSGATVHGCIHDGALSIEAFDTILTAEAVEGTIAEQVTFSMNASGKSKDGNVSIEAKGLRFLAGKQIMIERVVTKIPAPSEGASAGLVQYLAPGSNAVLGSGQSIEIIMNRVGFDLTTGEILFAVDETVKRDGVPTSSAQPETEEPPTGEVRGLGGFSVGGGVIEAKLTEALQLKKVKGSNELELRGGLAMKLGPLKGQLDGVSLYLPLGPDNEVPGEEEKQARGRVHVESGKLDDDLTVTNLWVRRGIVTIGSISLKLAKLLSGIPDELASLRSIDVTATSVEVSTDRGISIGGVSFTAPTQSFLDGKLKLIDPTVVLNPRPFVMPADPSGSLLPSGWSLSAGGGVEVKPTENLSFSAASGSRLTLDARGVSGALVTPTVAWKGYKASAKEISFKPGGFLVQGAELGFSVAQLQDLPMIGDVLSLFPDWMDHTGSPKFALRGLDVGYQDKQLTFSPLSKLRLGVRAAKIKLGKKMFAEFNLDEGWLSFGAALDGDFSATAQIPLAHGVGIELGAGLAYKLAAAPRIQVANVEDVIQITGGLALTGSLEGYAKAGVFGGVPSVFSAAGGVYVSVKLEVGMTADVRGQWPLPTSKSSSPGGFDAFFKLEKDGKPPAIIGAAGLYVSLHFLGTSKMLRKELTSARIAELAAHGGVHFRAGEGFQFLPIGAFPAYKLHLDPQIEKMLFDADFAGQYDRAQHQLDKRFAEVDAASETLREKEPPGREQLATEEKAKAEVLASATAELEDLDRKDHAGVQLLNALQQELGKAEWRLAQLQKLEREEKTATTSFKRLFQHPTWGAFRSYDLAGKPAFKARPVVAEADATKRVDERDFPTTLGLEKDKVKLDAPAFTRKIAAKREEIAVVESRRDDDHRAELEDNKAQADAAHAKAKAKLDLSGKSREEVKQARAEAQDRLLDSLYVASKVDARSSDAKLEGLATIGRLEAELEHATKKLAAKPKEGATPEELELHDAQRIFWEEHVKFLTVEIEETREREKAREEAPELFDAKLAGHHRRVLDRAVRQRPEKVNELHARTIAKVLARKKAIEHGLSVADRKRQDLDKKAVKTKMAPEDLELAKTQALDAVQLQKAQLAAYIDTLVRLAALLDGDGVDKATEAFEESSKAADRA
jgi:hypothetical protein